MRTKEAAYSLARTVDKWILKATDSYHITIENTTNWRLFTRTIQSTLDIINSECDRVEKDGN